MSASLPAEANSERPAPSMARRPAMASNRAPLWEKIEMPPGVWRLAWEVLKPIESGWWAL